MMIGFPIYIHCWGGFGSQLNAYFFYQFLNKISRRPLKLIFHSSGVTRRPIEIDFLLKGKVSYQFVDDFTATIRPSIKKKQNIHRRMLSFMARLFRILISPQSIDDLHPLFPWTISVRGTYSHCRYSRETLDIFLQALSKYSNTYAEPQGVVHYRLGDLVEIDKEFVSGVKITQLINSVYESNWLLISDSSSLATKQLINISTQKVLSISDANSSIDILNFCIKAKVFIGTNSKLSIWASVLRASVLGLPSFMPLNLKDTIIDLVDIQAFNKILFYDAS